MKDFKNFLNEDMVYEGFMGDVWNTLKNSLTIAAQEVSQLNDDFIKYCVNMGVEAQRNGWTEEETVKKIKSGIPGFLAKEFGLFKTFRKTFNNKDSFIDRYAQEFIDKIEAAA